MSGIPFWPAKPIRGGIPLDPFFQELMADPAWMSQAKLDGRRAVWDGHGVLWSRQGNNINEIAPSVVQAMASIKTEVDGEFIRTLGEA